VRRLKSESKPVLSQIYFVASVVPAASGSGVELMLKLPVAANILCLERTVSTASSVSVNQPIGGRGGNAHFKESVYELHKRESHGWRHFWARGYFSTTSGNITDDVILQYLQKHEPIGASR
jgi:REP element-mobilizing transposase RayT